MDKFLKDIKVRFGTFETVEGVTLAAAGGVLFIGGVLGLLPYISAGLMILGGYKIWKKRNGR